MIRVLCLFVTLILLGAIYPNDRLAYAAVKQGKLGSRSVAKTDVTLIISVRSKVQKIQTLNHRRTNAICLTSNDGAGFIIKIKNSSQSLTISNNGKDYTLDQNNMKMPVRPNHRACSNADSENAYTFMTKAPRRNAEVILEPL